MKYPLEHQATGLRRHQLVVIETRRLRDLFERLWWVGCQDCKMRRGPYTNRAAAIDIRRMLDTF